MRLTLRTMLAYLDDILEPQDAQGLEQKIEESKFASDLVHRIRSSMRRLRLGAPKVDGKGMADDANTVAEYLDNSPTMTPDKVLEFEKVCLESDVHLAEVASAHQILTHVLREPAIFEPAIRDRIYDLGHGDAAAIAAAANAARHDAPAASVHTEPEPVMVHTPAVSEERAALAHVPMVLGRQPKSSFPLASLAMTLVLGFVLAVVALRAMGELNSNHPVLRLLVGGRPAEQVAQTSNATANSSTSSVQGTENVASTGVSQDSATKPADAASDTNVDPSSRPAEPPIESPVPESSTTSTVENIAAKPDVPSVTTPPANPDVPIEGPAKTTTEVTTAVAPATATKPTRPMETNVPSVESVPQAPIKAGTYLSEDQMIAHWDAASKAWLILPPKTVLMAGEELLSLPTFRPQVSVSPNVIVTLVGESYMKMHVPDAANLPRITIDSGRATLMPVGEMGGSIAIDVGGRSGVLSFDDIGSAAAIEVRLYLPRGSDPLTDAPHLVTKLWATSGSIEWKEQGQPVVNVPAGQMAFFLDESPMEVNAKAAIPDWVDGKDLSDIDRRASIELRKFLSPERPLSLSLMELTNYRQVEVRSLACRTLAHLDIYEPALESLGDDQLKAYWVVHYDALQTRMFQGAEPAARLKATVDKLFNDRGDLVFHMLRGYSSEQLKAGGARELVDELSNQSMAIRALAQENLKRITGKTLNFRPEYPPEKEKSKVLQWRKLLEDGQIDYNDQTRVNP